MLNIPSNISSSKCHSLFNSFHIRFFMFIFGNGGATRLVQNSPFSFFRTLFIFINELKKTNEFLFT